MIVLSLSVLVFLYLFWCIYILVMGLYRLHLKDELHGLNKVLAYPAVIVGLLIDVIVNWTVAIVLFMDFPKEYLVTQRLIRYRSTESLGWRDRVATYICDNILDVFDPRSNHC